MQRTHQILPLLAVLFLATAAQVAGYQAREGATVDFDRVTSSNPNMGAWDRGVVIGTTR